MSKRKIITNEGVIMELARVDAQEWVDAKAAKFYTDDMKAEVKADPTDVPVQASPAIEKSAPVDLSEAPKPASKTDKPKS